MDSIKRKEIANGVFFNSIKDSRFKTMRISANALVPLSADAASSNALLFGVLSHSCKAYPDFTVLSKKLSSLYGADLTVSVRKAGDCQDDRYAFEGESVARELSLLLCSVIFEPNVTHGAFDEGEVEQERRQLLDVIDSEFNDKRIYANDRLIKNMCANEVFGLNRYGTAEKIKEATVQSLYSVWQNLLKNAKFEIMFIGDSASEKAEEVFKNAFSKVQREPYKLSTQVVRSAETVKHISEEMELSQSKLVMGFRTDIAVPDKEVNAARLMCAILGGTANSKLFCNVREKQSLCYYCAARYDKLKGIMTIDSGVEGDNINKAEKAILKEVEDMKNGKITDFEMDSTKLAVVNSFRATNDTVSGIESWYANQLFEGDFKSIEQVSAEINEVTKEQIVKAAQRLTLDTVYVLKNK